MSALREWAATLGGEARKAVDVSAMGKWKTATQVGSQGVEGGRGRAGEKGKRMRRGAMQERQVEGGNLGG
jgi:hypothetical protein